MAGKGMKWLIPVGIIVVIVLIIYGSFAGTL